MWDHPSHLTHVMLSWKQYLNEFWGWSALRTTEVLRYETELDYQHASIIFLKDALDEVISGREVADERIAELQRQINAQNDGIEQMKDELRERYILQQRDADHIKVLKSEIARLSIHAGGDQTEGHTDGDLIRADQAPAPCPRPLKEWRSHHGMFFTARVKPDRDTGLGQDHIPISSVEVEINGSPSILLHDPQTGIDSRHKFDHCFGPQDTNDDIWSNYQELLLEGLAENYIVAIATDGPSGSGKTYTMFKGRNALIPTAIYNTLQQESNNGRSVQVRAVEVYKNDTIDVVHKADKSNRLGAPLKPTHRGPISWKDFQVMDFSQTSTLESITNRILLLNSRRTNKDTAMNTSRSPLRGGSSRGHLVVIVTHGNADTDHNAGRLVFIDLAGTEERGINNDDIDAEYDDIRKDRSEYYVFFKNFARNPTTYGDRTLIKFLKPLLRQPNRTTKIAHIFHISTADHERNMLLMVQKKELEHNTVNRVRGTS
ncbi:hypothetical protein ES702_02633 [subsurface metagenome]